jgi:acetoin utilization protein AcuC
MNTDRKKAFVHTSALAQNGYPDECPFHSRRAGQLRGTLASMDLLTGSDRFELSPEPLSRSDLELFHDAAYIDALDRAGRGDLSPDEALMRGLGTPDCPIFKDMLGFLSLAAGASVTGARALLSGQADIAFNPSGGFHHAQPASAAGFCYLNDIVFAALEFTRAGKRVLFLDIDVHHADGVQDAFYTRSDILTVSLHESGKTLFPGTGFENEIGEGEGRGYTVNFPLPVGTYDGAYRKLYAEAVKPLILQYDPDVIILELGMDALAGDPLAHLHLTNNVHADIVQSLVDIEKPLLVTGGGGYNIEQTVRGWALCWSVLTGDSAMLDAMMFGMGGIMLENTDWAGGLRDRALLADGGRRDVIDPEIDRLIAHAKTTFDFGNL